MKIQSTKTDLLIFPYNGNAIEAADCVGDTYRVIGFVDDNKDIVGQRYGEIPIYTRSAFLQFPQSKVLAVPGNVQNFRSRQQLIEGLNLPSSRYATLIHPKAALGAQSNIGYNVVLMAGVVITSNCTVGNHVCILPNSVVHHDSSIGEFTLIGSSVTVAGKVSVGANCYLGSSCSLISSIRIGASALIGMGATVLSSVDPGITVVGTPARKIK